jgi:general secretion pathway protein N
VRFADAGPRTWLLAGLAGWAVALWLLAVLGMGGSIARLPDDPNLLARLPTPRAAGPERIGPLAQYAETGSRPLFSEDRRPQPFVMQAEGTGEQAPAFDFILTSVLITPQVRMAIVQPSGGGESIRMKLGEAPDEAQGWRLVSIEPRSAVFEGPQGQKSLELRTFNGTGGETPTAVNTEAPANARPVGVTVQQPARATRPAAPATTNRAATAPAPTPQPATPPTTGSDLADTPMTPEAQMEAIRKRIEARRAQLREEAQRQQQQNAANK